MRTQFIFKLMAKKIITFLCFKILLNPLLHRLFINHIIFCFLDNIEKIQEKFWILFENIMENGAFAPKEQMLHFPYFFQIHDISKASKGVIME